MKKLTDKEIEKISNLIKIHIPVEERNKYATQLNTVLEAVEVLKELNTAKTPETSQTHGLENITREDEPKEGLIIGDYPNKQNLEDGYFVVDRFIN